MENPKLYTQNLVPGQRTYGEKIVNFNRVEYRLWDPYRSKLAAFLHEAPVSNILKRDLNCLYLGAASGTTVSHLSDILSEGVIFAVEFAERSIRQLIQNTSERKNVIPILGDANYPHNYAKSIYKTVDLIYQDVAQPNQAEIAIFNANYYLRKGGYILFAIKSQSIDSVRKSNIVYAEEKQAVENAGYEIKESINIHKFAANHIMLSIYKP
jgi:fibrillarin-like pre-rRNA processing protein